MLSKNVKINVFRTVLLCVYDIWSSMLKEEHRFRVFENRLPRSVFIFKRDEVMGSWRKLHSEELHRLYSSLDVIRMIKSRRMR
jgi:hypothetical protein